jgi:hypothetical protein
MIIMKSLNSDGQQLQYQQNKQIPLISNQGTQNKVNLIYGIGIPGPGIFKVSVHKSNVQQWEFFPVGNCYLLESIFVVFIHSTIKKYCERK